VHDKLNPIVYLTAEFKSRDLDSRLLIAAHLLKAGFPVVLGQQWAIIANAPTASPGCYHFKTANAFQAGWMRDCSRHLVVACDEEALPFSGDGFTVNIVPEALENSQLFLVQADAHRQVLREKYRTPDNAIEVVGSPRLELLARAKAIYAKEAAAVRAEHGDYILFNTSFGIINSIWGDVEAATGRLLSGGGLSDGDVEERIEVERKNFDHLRDLLRWTSKRANVVVRPHPSENAKMWRDLGAVVMEGTNPIPWMLGAKAVVHSTSTTGIEANALGVPCLNLETTASWGNRFIMQEVNCTVSSADNAKAALEQFLTTGRGELADSVHLRKKMPADGAGNTAKAIARLLLEHDIMPGPAPADFAWKMIDGRPDATKAKFFVTPEEISRIAPRIFQSVGLKKVTFGDLDESVFLFSPGT